MMQKEEKVVIVLLIMAVLSLIIAFFGFSSHPGMYSKDSKLDERVYVEGTVLSKQITRTGDNLIITLSNLDVKVFVTKDNGAKDLYDSLRNGDKVRITGKVQEYKNVREIVVGSAGDVARV